ncbi:MAG: hypothetical protein RL613_994, partial [Fusobacteriota bacterium]
FMAHDIFPFVNIFVDTNILTRNYHEFLFHFKSVAIYYTIYDNKKLSQKDKIFILETVLSLYYILFVSDIFLYQ